MPTSIAGPPGVYFRERSARAPRALPTGVPVFVGLVTPDGVSAGGDAYGPVALHHKSEFAGGAAAYLGDAIAGFFDNGGAYCYVVGLRADPAGGVATATRMIDALALTTELDDVDLVAVPDASALVRADGSVDEALVLDVQRAVIAHCASVGGRVGVLDALRGKSAQALIDDHLRQLGLAAIGPVDAALYHPWIRTVGSGSRFVPPCGQVAGIIARTDAADGVFRAPANAPIQDAVDLDGDLDPAALELLNDNGVNAIRAFPGRGIRVFGARTLSADPDWRHLNVRRLVLTVVRWIDANMTWAAFEPNVPALWARIERELSTYLTGLWRGGALQGDVVTDAFFVRCDAERNPPASREAGQVITEIGLAPTAPAEFVVITVQHRAGTTELT